MSKTERRIVQNNTLLACKPIFILVVAAVLLLNTLQACTPAGAPAPGSTITPSKLQSSPSPSPTVLPKLTPNTPPLPVLDDVLATAAKFDTIAYDLVVTEPGKPTSTSKLWVKGERTRIETAVDNVTTVYLFDGIARKTYLYVPMVKMAVESPLPEGPLPYSPAGFAKYVRPLGPKMTGPANVGGQSAITVEYKDTDGRPMKVWLAQENGLILRSEDASTNQTTEVKNATFAGILESRFQLPQGTRVVPQTELTAALSPKTYTNSECGYSLVLPPGWQVNDTSKQAVLIKADEVTLSISMDEISGVTLEGVMEISRETLDKYTSEWEEISTKKIVSGEYSWYVQTVNFKTKSGMYLWRGQRMLLAIDDRAFIFAAEAMDDYWARNENAIAGVFSSIQVTRRPKVYREPTYGYSIELASGWKASSISKDVVTIKSPDQAAMLSISVLGEAPATLDVLFDASVKGSFAKSPNFREVSRAKIAMSGNLPAWGIIYTRESPTVRQMVLMLVKDKALFVVRYSMADNLFDKYSPDVQKMLSSLKFDT